MVSKVFLLSTLITALYQGFVIPDGLENSVYTYDLTTNNHTKVEALASTYDLYTLGDSTKFATQGKGLNTKATCGTTILTSLDYRSALQ